jgi:hypothetical protein
MTWYHRARRRPAIWLAPLLLLPALAGCSQPKGHLSGKVIYQGQPLPGGWLTFRPADSKQNTVSVMIDAEGHYDVTLPAGDVAIAVDNRELKPHQAGPRPSLPPGIKLPGQDGGVKVDASGPASGGGKLSGKYVPIPEKFYQVETSGLKYTVKGGSEPYDIELK